MDGRAAFNAECVLVVKVIWVCLRLVWFVLLDTKPSRWTIQKGITSLWMRWELSRLPNFLATRSFCVCYMFQTHIGQRNERKQMWMGLPSCAHGWSVTCTHGRGREGEEWMYSLSSNIFSLPVGEANEFMIFSRNGEAEGPLPGNPCHFDTLYILSIGCILKGYVQEVLFEVSERNNNLVLDLAPTWDS